MERPKQMCGERRLTARARLYGQKNPASVCAKAGSCEAGFKRLAGFRGANSKCLFVISLFKIGRETLHRAEDRKGRRLARYTLYHARLGGLDGATGAANVLSERINNPTVKGRAAPSLLS